MQIRALELALVGAEPAVDKNNKSSHSKQQSDCVPQSVCQTAKLGRQSEEGGRGKLATGRCYC